jgi:hypothetical protein
MMSLCNGVYKKVWNFFDEIDQSCLFISSQEIFALLFYDKLKGLLILIYKFS